MQNGRESGVRTTPIFVVNRRIQDVSFGLGDLFDAVEWRCETDILDATLVRV